ARKTLRDQSDRRATELEQELSAAKKDLSKSLHDLKSAQAESAAARKEFREKEIVLTTEMTRAQGSVDQEKDKSAGLKDELEDLKKRLGRAGDLTARETEIKEQRTKFEAEKRELEKRQGSLDSHEIGEHTSELQSRENL